MCGDIRLCPLYLAALAWSSEMTVMPGAASDGAYNAFRDSPLRYCGYANEVGESFRYQYPRSVVPSYLIAFGYCFADAASASYGVISEDKNITAKQTRSKETRAAIAGLDTLLWQGLASVAIPGGVINLIVRASRVAVRRSAVLPVMLSKWFPTAAGLFSIPFIITPIDQLVDYALDNSTRKMLRVDD